MKLPRLIMEGVLGIALAFAVGCGDDNGEVTDAGAVTLADIAGNWTLVKWEFLPRRDLIARGWTATMTIDADGRFERTNTLLGSPDVTFTVEGTFTIEGSNIIVNGALAEPVVAAFTLTSDMFTLTSAGVFDTDLDGVPDIEGTSLEVWQRMT